MATVADVIIGELRAAGVRTLFGVPGGASNLDLVEAAGKAGLPFVLTATETGAAIAAMAQAEVTGQLGACLTTLGPGAASVVNGVACAFLDRAPVLVFTDSHATATYEHQHLDQAALFAPITHASLRVTPDNVAAVMAEAKRRAQSPRPGPVHIECPGDVGAANELVADLKPVPAKSATSSFDLNSASELLSHARRPILLVGLGARRPEDAAAIRALCEQRRVPALVTYKAKGVVPDDHAWFGGVFTNGAIEQPLVSDSDLIIGIGLDPVELIPRAWPYRQPVVYAGPWPVPDTHVPFATQLIAPVLECVARIEPQLGASTWAEADVRRFVSAQRSSLPPDSGALTARGVVEIAAAHLAATTRVTVDAGAHMFPATILWPVSSPNHMLISNGLSTMGFAVPAAIGAALADPSTPVVALTGDGGLLMCAGELLTAAREKLRIMVIVFSDDSLSLIEIKQQSRGLRPAGVSVGGINWRALATSLGLTPFPASTGEELRTAITGARACEGPALIEARIDRSNYGATLRAIRG
jgi:acetolactate synthase-1/2/3 large subunit